MLAKEIAQLLKEYPILRATAENLEQQLTYKKSAGIDPAELDALSRKLTETRFLLDQLNRGLSALTDEERLVLDRMYINPKKGMTMALCEALEVEVATVYRRRNKALEKLTRAMPGRHAPEAMRYEPEQISNTPGWVAR